MTKRFSVEQALDENMCPATPREMQENETSTSSEDEYYVDFVVESDNSASSSSSPDLSTENGEDTKDSETKWSLKSGHVWFPTNAETNHDVPAAGGLIPGLIQYTITRSWSSPQ